MCGFGGFRLTAVPKVLFRRKSVDPAKLAETIRVSLEKNVLKNPSEKYYPAPCLAARKGLAIPDRSNHFHESQALGQHRALPL
jgi:hypothetical protein